MYINLKYNNSLFVMLMGDRSKTAKSWKGNNTQHHIDIGHVVVDDISFVLLLLFLFCHSNIADKLLFVYSIWKYMYLMISYFKLQEYICKIVNLNIASH